MRRITLTQGHVALVDNDDYVLLSAFSWCWIKNAGAQTRIGKQRILMHRLILDAKPGQIVDHINHDRLDNRRCNLRIVTQQQNCWNQVRNKHGFKGVYLNGKRYRAQIRVNGANLELGCFDTSEEAAKAYDAAAREHFGEFAYVNFPTPAEAARQRQIPRQPVARERLWRPVRTSKLNYEEGLRRLAITAKNFSLK